MASYSLFLVKNANPQTIQQLLGHAEYIDGSAWVRGNFRKDVSPPDDAVLVGDESLTQTLSETLGEVVFVYGDTSADGFVYEHSREGKIVRKLVWFPMLDEDWTAGWLCAEGEPEPWEATLFRAHQLEQFLANEEFRYEDEGRSDEFEAYAEEVRTDWASGRIKAGQNYPECDGTAALLIERYYGVERQG
jgi:hypothetical protein